MSEVPSRYHAKFGRITRAVLDLSNWSRKRRDKELPCESLDEAIALLNEYSAVVMSIAKKYN